jgi:hypothetical protein
MLRDKILSFKSQYVPVEVPEWGDGPFYIRKLTGGDVAKVQSLVHKLPPQVAEMETAFWFIVLCLCDQDGTRILKEEDYEHVRQFPISVIRKLSDAIGTANAIGMEGLEAAKNG